MNTFFPFKWGCILGGLKICIIIIILNYCTELTEQNLMLWPHHTWSLHGQSMASTYTCLSMQKTWLKLLWRCKDSSNICCIECSKCIGIIKSFHKEQVWYNSMLLLSHLSMIFFSFLKRGLIFPELTALKQWLEASVLYPPAQGQSGAGGSVCCVVLTSAGDIQHVCRCRLTRVMTCNSPSPYTVYLC